MIGWNFESSFVAFLDILGYKELIKNNEHIDLTKLYDHIIPIITDHNQTNLTKIEAKNQYIDLQNNSNVFSTMVSDSIILWSEDCTITSFVKIIDLIATILSNGVFHYFPIRGAMTTGTISGKYYNKNNSFSQLQLYGKPIVEAYELSESANWMGCEVAKECIEMIHEDENLDFKELLEEEYIVEYEIPKKNGEIKVCYALNWMKHCSWKKYYSAEEIKYSIEDLIRKSFAGHHKSSNNWNVEAKILNTLDFIKDVGRYDLNYKNWPNAVELSNKLEFEE
ncbi:MAG: hypothetical protein GX638_16905 [Crenarchaeota archaeon]|nr:hypothetical protein [Thermoproteota archaeon]